MDILASLQAERPGNISTGSHALRYTSDSPSASARMVRNAHHSTHTILPPYTYTAAAASMDTGLYCYIVP